LKIPIDIFYKPKKRGEEQVARGAGELEKNKGRTLEGNFGWGPKGGRGLPSGYLPMA